MGNKRSGQVRTTASSGSNKTYIIVGAVIAAFLAGFIALVVIDSRQQAGSAPPEGVEEISVPSRDHTERDVDYAQDPPVGGDHNPVWQNAGFYEAPVREENAVHTMEHGAVWITYSPDLPPEQANTIRNLVQSQDCMLASPVEGLDSPVVASSWGRQLRLDSADSPDLERFVRAFRLGPETPEPGATCTGGTADAA